MPQNLCFCIFCMKAIFLVGHFCFKCHVKNPQWYLIKQDQTFCYERNFRKDIKHVLRKVILKGNIITKYIEHWHTKILELVLIYPQNVEKQYH